MWINFKKSFKGFVTPLVDFQLSLEIFKQYYSVALCNKDELLKIEEANISNKVLSIEYLIYLTSYKDI